jgi:hypothetical protein
MSIPCAKPINFMMKLGIKYDKSFFHPETCRRNLNFNSYLFAGKLYFHGVLVYTLYQKNRLPIIF